MVTTKYKRQTENSKQGIKTYYWTKSIKETIGEDKKNYNRTRTEKLQNGYRPYLSILTLNVNRLSSPIERQSDWID
jgi:hypothetical protein